METVENLGATLYKYLPEERIDYLDSSLLRFTPPLDLNDPYECLPHLDQGDFATTINQMIDRAHQEHIGKLTRATKWEKREIEKVLNRAAEATRRDFVKNPSKLSKLWLDSHLKNASALIGIFSLSRRWNSAPMWAHYSDGGKGYCIGFDPKHEFFSRQKNDTGDTGTLNPVNYSTTRVKIAVSNPGTTMELSFYNKHLDWQYEEEIRLVRKLENSKRKHDRAEKLPIHLFEVPHTAVREIILGANATEALTLRATLFASLFKIPLFKVILQISNYDFDREHVLLK